MALPTSAVPSRARTGPPRPTAVPPKAVPATASLVLRAYRPGDRFAVQAMADDLSPTTLYARFLVGVPTLPKAYVERLDTGAHAPDAVLLAVVGPFVVGVGELVVQPRDPRRGELALLVRDGYQRRGIGFALAERLVRHACHHGLAVLEAEALSGSRAIRALVRRHFPGATATPSGPTTHYELDLGDLRP
jgi:RimJ/RimL family protein N-acetyltransferase